MLWATGRVRRLTERGGVVALVWLLALAGVVGPWAATPVAAATGINVQLPVGHHISGHVYGPGHVPLAGAGVSASGNPQRTPAAQTAADGSFVLHGVPDGTFQVRFDAPDGSNFLPHWYGAPTSSQDPTGASNIVVAGANVSGIDGTLEIGRTISGTVTGDGVHPVAGIQVGATSQCCAGGGIVGANGAYTINALFPGVYSLYINSNGAYEPGAVVSGAVIDQPFGGSTIDVSTANATGTNITASAGVSINGHISGTGGPIDVSASGYAGTFGSGSAVTSSSGDYTIEGLWPGSYVVYFSSVPDLANPADSAFAYGAYANGLLVDQNLAAPVDASAGSITLASIVVPVGTTFSGTITGDGLPLANAYVEVCDSTNNRGCATTSTATDGGYAFNYIETGDWTVFAIAPHHVGGYYGSGGYVATSASATPVHVDAGGPNVAGIDIILPDGGQVAGTITGPGGVPVGGAFTSVPRGQYPGQPPCKSATDGSFACDGLAAGLYSLFVYPPDGQDFLPGYYDAGAPGNYTSDGRLATEIKVTDTHDTIPPTIVSESPAPGVHGVPRDTSILVGFSEEVNGIGPKTFQLEVDGSTAPLPGAYKYDVPTHMATLKPSAILNPATRYRVVVTTGITDDAGNKLVRSSWTFTTTSDATPPTVIHKLPQAGSLKNPQLISVTAQFSEQVRGFTANTFVLVNRANQSHVQGIISYDPTTRTVRFNAPYGLDLNVQYLVVLEPGITDLAGNPLSRYSWTFTTGE